MTREEQIAAAFYDCYNETDLSACDFDYIDMQGAFEEGAEWADNHPVNVWHNASEEPKADKLLLGLDREGVSLYKWCKQKVSWECFVNCRFLAKWAYIDDLLPKVRENDKKRD